MSGLIGRPNVLQEFGKNPTARDFFDVMTGDHLGKGAFREVFRSRLNPSHVIKIEMGVQSFHNVFEWQTWNRLGKTPAGRWLAPCIDISACGIVLIQRFAETVLDSELPTEIPGFFTDLIPDNWGRYQKRIVCRDYGSTKLIDIGGKAHKRKAEWKLHGTAVRNP